MRLQDGRYHCAHCGHVLDLPEGSLVTISLEASAGARTMRVIKQRGTDIHRCAFGSAPVEREPRRGALP